VNVKKFFLITILNLSVQSVVASDSSYPRSSNQAGIGEEAVTNFAVTLATGMLTVIETGTDGVPITEAVTPLFPIVVEVNVTATVLRDELRTDGSSLLTRIHKYNNSVVTRFRSDEASASGERSDDERLSHIATKSQIPGLCTTLSGQMDKFKANTTTYSDGTALSMEKDAKSALRELQIKLDEMKAFYSE